MVRFVRLNKTIQQRLLALSFLSKPLTGNSLAAQVIHQIMTLARQSPEKMRFNTVDGYASNNVANEVMQTIFPQCCDLICVAHTSNSLGPLGHLDEPPTVPADIPHDPQPVQYSLTALQLQEMITSAVSSALSQGHTTCHCLCGTVLQPR